MVRSRLDTASAVALNSLRPIHSADLGTWTGWSNALAIGRLRLLALSARKAVIDAKGLATSDVKGDRGLVR